MRSDLLNFILKFELDPFSFSKTLIKREKDLIYRTSDAKKIHNRVIEKLSRDFIFKETDNLWNFFDFLDSFEAIRERQEFFRSLEKRDNSYLRRLKKPRQTWDPKYDVVVITEDENTFVELQKLNCPVQLIINDNDLSGLEKYDLIQVIDCEMYGSVLERLPQCVFIDDITNIYLERYLEELSCFSENYEILLKGDVSSGVKEILDKLKPLFDLIDIKINKNLTIESVEEIVEDINEKINSKIKDMTISGESLIKILGEGKMPESFERIINEALDESGLNREIFVFKIPIEIDYNELESEIKKRDSMQFTNLAEEIKRNAEELKNIPELIDQLKAHLILEDFCLGLYNYLDNKKIYPVYSENFHMSSSENLFLNNPQPIDFQLDNFSKCSILTGANSGGKTTLLEHIIQNISLFYLGLPISGEIHMPLFSDVYYFAKNKGSANKGAFENLLTQMSKIKAGKKTLILADEIEAVTEPGVAGKIIAATCEYFINLDSYLVIATHLGHEIQTFLPNKARIDGIEAKGLDNEFNLIVDHNPIIGRLAHSTPELIVEKMSKTFEDIEYFKFLNEKIKN
ncbi:MAG: hypothetical protein WC260_02320 [Candidatus Pacearchaeota archaeon]